MTTSSQRKPARLLLGALTLAILAGASSSVALAQESGVTESASANQQTTLIEQQQEPIAGAEKAQVNPLQQQQLAEAQEQSQQQVEGEQEAATSTPSSGGPAVETQTRASTSAAPTETPSVQADVGSSQSQVEQQPADQQQQQQQAERQSEEQRLVDEATPQGVIMRENLVEQQPQQQQQQPQQQQQQGAIQVATSGDEERFTPVPLRVQKSGRANKRVHDDHVGVFGRKRTSSGASKSAESATRKQQQQQQRNRHYYYQTLGAVPKSQEASSQQQQQQQQRTSDVKSLKAADFPEDYREILVQPDNLAASQEYEVQRQQQRQQQRPSDVGGQQTVASGDKISEPEQTNRNSADESAQMNGPSDGAGDQQQLISVQQAEQVNDQQQGFEQADESVTSASAPTPYIRLSNVATINSTSAPSANLTALGASLQAPSGGEMKLMRIYVIDLDQKLVVSNSGASFASVSQEPQASTQSGPSVTGQSGEQQQQQAQFEQAKISGEAGDEQREQTSTIYATTSLPQLAAQHYDSSSSALSAPNASHHQRRQQPAHESMPTNHQQQVSAMAQAAKLMPSGDYVLLDRDSLQANLSQIMAQMGHYAAPGSPALAHYAPAQAGPPANHQPQNYTAATQYYSQSPSAAAHEYEQTLVQHNQQQTQAPMTMHGNYSYEQQQQLAALNYTSPYSNNSRNQYLGPQQQQQQMDEASAKLARASGNWSLASEPHSNYGQLGQSVAYPAVVQVAHASHPHNQQQQQQQAQFAAVYPALPQYIAPQYARANSTRGGAQAPAEQSAAEQYAEWPAQGVAFANSDTNYTAASNYSGRPLHAGPSPVQLFLEHQQAQHSSAGGQLDKYQPAAQSRPPQHLFAYSQQPADYMSMYQAHPIGHYGEPGQAQQANVVAGGQAPAKAPSAPLDGHWKPVDLAASGGPFISYGPAAAAGASQLQGPAPRPINGHATQQPDHDIVSLSALGQQQAQNGSYALVNGTAHLIADGEHAQLNYYAPAEQHQQYSAAQSGASSRPRAYAKHNNGAYVNSSPEQQQQQQQQQLLLQAGQYAEPDLAPSQQVHNHPSSHQAQAYAGAQHNGTGTQISTTDYHQSTLTPGAGTANQAAGSFGVTNEYARGLLAPQAQVSYTSKRQPSKQQWTEADQSSASDEAPKIPQAYSIVAKPAAGSSSVAGSYRRPVTSYSGSSQAPNATGQQVAHSSLASAGEESSSGAGESESSGDEGYESEQAEVAPPQAAGYSASPAYSKAPGKPSSSTRYFKKPYKGAGATRRPPSSKANYGQDAETSALYQQQQQLAEAAGEQPQPLTDAYQTAHRPQGIRQYLSGMAGDHDGQQYLNQMQALGRPVMRVPHLAAAGAYYRPMGAPKSLLSWQTLSSVASGAAKRLPTAISSFLSPFAAGMSGVASRPLYPTSQSVGYPNLQANFAKSPHFAGDVANFHRPYPFRHMSGPETYSDATPTNQHGAPLEGHASEEQPTGEEAAGAEEAADDLSGSSSSDSNSSAHADAHSVSASSLNSTSAGQQHEQAESGELIGDLAEIRPDGTKPTKAKRPAGATKTKGKRPAKPVISGDANSAGKQTLEPAQAAVLSSIEHQLEQQQQQQQKPVKARRKAKKTRPGAAPLDSAASFADGATGLGAEQQAGVLPVSLESLPLEQQRLLMASAKANPLMGLGKPAGPLQVPPSPTGLMFGADGSPLAASAEAGLMGPPGPRPGGLNSLQIGQYKITPQTQFVQSIIEPSRQMLGQYFKQYIGQLGQLG